MPECIDKRPFRGVRHHHAGAPFAVGEIPVVFPVALGNVAGPAIGIARAHVTVLRTDSAHAGPRAKVFGAVNMPIGHDPIGNIETDIVSCEKVANIVDNQSVRIRHARLVN